MRGWIVEGRFPRELLAANQRGRNQTQAYRRTGSGRDQYGAGYSELEGGTHNGTPGRLSDASEASVRLAFRVFVMRVSQTHARLSDASEASVRLASRATALSLNGRT